MEGPYRILSLEYSYISLPLGKRFEEKKKLAQDTGFECELRNSHLNTSKLSTTTCVKLRVFLLNGKVMRVIHDPLAWM